MREIPSASLFFFITSISSFYPPYLQPPSRHLTHPPFLLNISPRYFCFRHLLHIFLMLLSFCLNHFLSFHRTTHISIFIAIAASICFISHVNQPSEGLSSITSPTTSTSSCSYTSPLALGNSPLYFLSLPFARTSYPPQLSTHFLPSLSTSLSLAITFLQHYIILSPYFSYPILINHFYLSLLLGNSPLYFSSFCVFNDHYFLLIFLQTLISFFFLLSLSLYTSHSLSSITVFSTTTTSSSPFVYSSSSFHWVTFFDHHIFHPFHRLLSRLVLFLFSILSEYLLVAHIYERVWRAVYRLTTPSGTLAAIGRGGARNGYKRRNFRRSHHS